MPLDAANLATNFGFAGIIFVIWYFDMKKIDKLQKVIEDQVEDKQTMRAQADKYIQIIELHSALMERMGNILRRMEKKM